MSIVDRRVNRALSEFFDNLPSACIAYSTAIGFVSLALIVVRIAVNVWTGV